MQMHSAGELAGPEGSRWAHLCLAVDAGCSPEGLSSPPLSLSSSRRPDWLFYMTTSGQCLCPKSKAESTIRHYCHCILSISRSIEREEEIDSTS